MPRSLLLAALLLSLPGCYLSNEVLDTQADQVPGEYVVGLAAGASALDLEEVGQALGLELVALRGANRLAVFRDPQERAEAEVLGSLGDSGTTSFAEPHYVYGPVLRPDDYGEYQWGLHNTGINGGRAGADIGAFEAWDRSRGEGVLVAVIDSGIDASHPDLAGQLWTNPDEVPGNGIDDDGNGYVDDVHGYDFVFDDGDPDDRTGHGTHVAGIVAARGDEGYGLVGTAYEARVMALKFLDPAGGGMSSMAAEAINYAVNQGAQVINASWGGFGYSHAIRSAIAYARSQGVLFVAAAGNQANDNDRYGFYPAGYELDNVVSVAASDRRDELSSFSSYGQTSVDLAAPGSQVVSTWLNGDWVYSDGTSMASPFVAGSAALVWSAHPDASALQVSDALLETVEPLAWGADRVATGGRLQAAAALQWLDPVTPPDEGTGGEDEGGADTPPPEWTFVAQPIETQHPYGNHQSESWTLEGPPEASELRLHFEWIDLESGYDFLRVHAPEGDKLAEWSGEPGEVITGAFPHRKLRLDFDSDYSVTEWGFKFRGYSWR